MAAPDMAAAKVDSYKSCAAPHRARSRFVFRAAPSSVVAAGARGSESALGSKAATGDRESDRAPLRPSVIRP